MCMALPGSNRTAAAPVTGWRRFLPRLPSAMRVALGGLLLVAGWSLVWLVLRARGAVGSGR